MSAICGQSVTVWTDATERSRYVVATEGALVTHFLTLVNVLTYLHGSRSKSIRAVAFESSLHIGAGTVATNVGDGTFVIINAFDAAAIQYEAHWAFAAEGSVGIDTLSAFANAWHDTTFVEILSFRSATGSTWTKFLKFGSSFRWAFFAGVAPSASHSATTLSLGHGSGSRI